MNGAGSITAERRVEYFMKTARWLWALTIVGALTPSSGIIAAPTAVSSDATATHHGVVEVSSLPQMRGPPARGGKPEREHRDGSWRDVEAERGPTAPLPPSEIESTKTVSPAPSLVFDPFVPAAIFAKPDTHGAVGDNHVMTVTNAGFWIHTKTGSLVSAVSAITFWASVSPSPTYGTYDTQIVYDATAARFVIMGLDTTSQILLGFSLTSDPTGTWKLYRVVPEPSNFMVGDRPTLGFSNSMIGITVFLNRTGSSPGPAVAGPRVLAIRKSALYAQPSAPVFSSFVANGGGEYTFMTLSAYTGAGTPSLFMTRRRSTTQYSLSRVDDDLTSMSFHENYATFLTPYVTSPQLNGNAQMGTTLPLHCFNQTSTYVDGTIYLTYPVFQHNMPTGYSKQGVGWQQVDASSGTVLQSGAIQLGAVDVALVCPSLTANPKFMAVGYTRTGVDLYAGAGYAVRTPDQAAGAIKTGQTVRNGLAAYTYETIPGQGFVVFGDYSAVVPDPSDACIFWSAQEYAKTATATAIVWAKVNACP